MTGHTITRKSLKLLIIEDNDDQWIIMQEAFNLRFREATLQRTATLEQTLGFLAQWRTQEGELPHLILLDLFLPTEAAGWQLLKQVKELSPALRRIPVVMFTNSSAVANIEEAYQLGVSSYLTKPIELADWLTCITQLRVYWWETVTLPPVRHEF
ncbi:response regulator [Spirosoma sp. HMF4905]|uniref:Response regulator n=1 Tax=Spirosoma arboris TaxID=2682092 RepID=A0A7K1S9E0_9BACT|nr:response regulator [Spirosoma arboris]MVM30453.1 response regulator [Spirosoma arboris]